MAFIILGDHEQEWERRPLRQAMTIGRSFDCDLPVRDTLLSRQHCRLEPHGNQWVLIDLKSRNGTRIGETPITHRILEDGDVVRIGQTRLCFRAGAFVPAPPANRLPSRQRPLDPHEAMATTMNGVELTAAAAHIPGFPMPKPKPNEPKSFEKDGVAALVSKMASGVWDSRLANQALTRRPAQMTPWSVEGLPVPKSAPARRKSAEKRSEKTARWLIMTYLVMAGSVFAASLVAIAWPGF
jgi:pSer/pThr/pTyr-binding forkhead associated (FHA) protein